VVAAAAWPARSEVIGGEEGRCEESNERIKRHKQGMPRAETTPALEEEPQKQENGSGRLVRGNCRREDHGGKGE
jgi:hypothetical protein